MSDELKKRIISSIILFPITIFFIYEGSILFNLFLIICFFLSAYEWHLMKKRNFINILGYCFLIFSFFTIFKIRNDFVGEFFYSFLILTICISTDVGGYVVGRIVKGPKLSKISPNKTFSGTIGSFLFSLISTFVYLDYFKIIHKIEFNYELIIFVILISIVSQIGDLFISYFKRLSKIKDTGKIIPGHGGLLDRIDGMIFSFPFSYIIISQNIFNFAL
tara:strand:- start:1362 stop:2018 length:657 start_codon:yes stop_codon:yes gene_type:complete